MHVQKGLLITLRGMSLQEQLNAIDKIQELWFTLRYVTLTRGMQILIKGGNQLIDKSK